MLARRLMGARRRPAAVPSGPVFWGDTYTTINGGLWRRRWTDGLLYLDQEMPPINSGLFNTLHGYGSPTDYGFVYLAGSQRRAQKRLRDGTVVADVAVPPGNVVLTREFIVAGGRLRSWDWTDLGPAPSPVGANRAGGLSSLGTLSSTVPGKSTGKVGFGVTPHDYYHLPDSVSAETPGFSHRWFSGSSLGVVEFPWPAAIDCDPVVPTGAEEVPIAMRSRQVTAAILSSTYPGPMLALVTMTSWECRWDGTVSPSGLSGQASYWPSQADLSLAHRRRVVLVEVPEAGQIREVAEIAATEWFYPYRSHVVDTRTSGRLIEICIGDRFAGNGYSTMLQYTDRCGNGFGDPSGFVDAAVWQNAALAPQDWTRLSGTGASLGNGSSVRDSAYAGYYAAYRLRASGLLEPAAGPSGLPSGANPSGAAHHDDVRLFRRSASPTSHWQVPLGEDVARGPIAFGDFFVGTSWGSDQEANYSLRAI